MDSVSLMGECGFACGGIGAGAIRWLCELWCRDCVFSVLVGGFRRSLLISFVGMFGFLGGGGCDGGGVVIVGGLI